jgi:hypothetical protein
MMASVYSRIGQISRVNARREEYISSRHVIFSGANGLSNGLSNVGNLRHSDLEFVGAGILRIASATVGCSTIQLSL